MKLKQYITEKKIPDEFKNDPLYMAVLNSKNKKEYDKALDTLRKIRGSSAVASFQKAMSK